MNTNTARNGEYRYANNRNSIAIYNTASRQYKNIDKEKTPLLQINHKITKRMDLINGSQKHHITMENGESCLNIASLNSEDLRRTTGFGELTIARLEIQKIDIACTQGTHNTFATNYAKNGRTTRPRK